MKIEIELRKMSPAMRSRVVDVLKDMVNRESSKISQDIQGISAESSLAPEFKARSEYLGELEKQLVDSRGWCNDEFIGATRAQFEEDHSYSNRIHDLVKNRDSLVRTGVAMSEELDKLKRDYGALVGKLRASLEDVIEDWRGGYQPHEVPNTMCAAVELLAECLEANVL